MFKGSPNRDSPWLFVSTGLRPDLPLYPIVVSPRKHCERLQVVVADPKQPISSKNTPRQQRRLTQIVVAEILAFASSLAAIDSKTFRFKAASAASEGREGRPCVIAGRSGRVYSQGSCSRLRLGWGSAPVDTDGHGFLTR